MQSKRQHDRLLERREKIQEQLGALKKELLDVGGKLQKFNSGEFAKMEKQYDLLQSLLDGSYSNKPQGGKKMIQQHT